MATLILYEPEHVRFNSYSIRIGRKTTVKELSWKELHAEIKIVEFINSFQKSERDKTIYEIL